MASPPVYRFRGARPRATVIPRRSASIRCNGGARPLPLGGWLDGHGTLEALVVAREPLPPYATPRSWHWALIAWGITRQRHTGEPRREPYTPSWTFWPSREDALDAAELLEDGATWSVIDSHPTPKPRYDGRTLDALVTKLRQEAAARRRLEVGRYER